jgi:hypothetical protein
VPTPGLVAITQAASAATVASQAVNNPATANGQLILLWAVAQQTPASFTGPAGFSAAAASIGNNIESRLFWKAADGTEGATLTVSVTGGTNRFVVLTAIALSGVDPALFDPSVPAASGAMLATTGTSIPSNDPGTTTGTGDLLVWIGAHRSGAPPYPAITVPAGYAAQGSQVSTGGAGAGVGTQVGTLVQASPGDPGAPAGILSTAQNGGALLVAIPGAVVGAVPVLYPGGAPAIPPGLRSPMNFQRLPWAPTLPQRPGFAMSVAPATAAAAATAPAAAPVVPPPLRAAQCVTTGAGSATLAVPALQCAAGDLIFIWAACGFPTMTWTSQAGDSLTAQTAVSGTGMSAQLFSKIADSTDVAKAAASGSYTLTISTSHAWSAVVGVVPVTSTAHPFDPSDTPGSGQVNLTVTAVTAASVTTAVSGDALAWLGATTATSAQGSVPDTITPPSGYSVPSGVSQATSSGSGTTNTGVLIATVTQPAAGATGSQAGSTTNARTSAGLLLAIKAAPVVPLPGVVRQVVAGAASASSVQAVAKTSGATSCRLAYSLSPSMTSPSYVAAQAPDSLGYVRYSVTGLAARTRYYLQLADTPAGGAETPIGPVGQAKTLPATGTPQSYTVAFASCIAGNDTTTPPATDAAITDWVSYDADLNVFTGDFDYSGTTSTDTPTQVGVFESQIAGVPSLGSMVSTRWGFYCRSDHEAGPDNGDSNNTYTATNIAAAQQVFPFGTLGDAGVPPRGLYQSWVAGRIRYIMTDVRNLDRSPGAATDDSSKTMLGAAQLAWLKTQLIQSEPLKIIISDPGWMGTATTSNGPDKWWSYDTERQAILAYIAANAAQVGNVMLWHGDTHLVGYATAAANTWGGFPVWCAAPMLNTGGGLYTGTFTAFYNNSGGECRLYGRVAVTDTGSAISLTFSGWDAAAGVAQVTRTETFVTGVTAQAGLAAASAAGASGTGTSRFTGLLALASRQPAAVVTPAAAITVAPGAATASAAAPAPAIAATSAVTVFPGLATATATAPAPAAKVTALPGLATATATAPAPAAKVTALPGLATAAGTAPAPAAVVTALPGLATATATAPAAQSVVTGLAGLATATATAPVPAIAATSAVTVFPGLAAATGTASAPAAIITAPAGLAAAAGSAPAPAAAVTAPAGLAAATGTAPGPARTVTALPGPALATSTAPAPAAGVTALAGPALAAGTAPAPGVSTITQTTAPAGLASAAGIASQPVAAVTAAPAAGLAAATAPAPAAVVTALAGLAVAAGTAPAPAAAAISLAGLAVAAGTAAGPVPGVTASAGLAQAAATAPAPGAAGRPGLASAAATAPAPVISTSSNVVAPAGLASASGTAPAPAAAVTAAAGLAAATGTAPALTAVPDALAGPATAAGTAPGPARAITVLTGLAAAAGTGPAPGPAVTGLAGLAAAAGIALAPAVSTVTQATAPAGLAAATGTAPAPGVSTVTQATALAGLAAATGTGLAPAAAATALAGLAAAAGTAAQGTASPAALAGLAAAAGTALAPALAVIARPGLAAAAGTAPAPVITTAAAGTGSARLAAATAAAPAPAIRAAVTSGPFPPGAAAVLPGGTGTWVNPGNALADDGNVATWAVP